MRKTLAPEIEGVLSSTEGGLSDRFPGIRILEVRYNYLEIISHSHKHYYTLCTNS